MRLWRVVETEKAMTPCPHCTRTLTVYYSKSAEEVRCQCDNVDCDLYQRGVTATADTTQEAIDRFNGLAMLKTKPRKTI